MFRQFTSTLLRSARPRPLYHARIPQRTLFGLGSKPAVGTPPLSEEELAKTTEWAQNLFKDKPDAVKAVIKVATVMEELGVQISAGQMPNPLQLLKLAKNPKFMEAYTEAQQEFKKAGIDMQSKELVEQMMKIINKRS